MKIETVELAQEKGFVLEGSTLTLADLQKWLREEHDIFVYVTPVLNLKDVSEYKFSLYRLSDNFRLAPSGVFDTYEESLEAGLQEALSKIKKDVLSDEIEKVVKAKTTNKKDFLHNHFWSEGGRKVDENWKEVEFWVVKDMIASSSAIAVKRGSMGGFARDVDREPLDRFDRGYYLYEAEITYESIEEGYTTYGSKYDTTLFRRYLKTKGTLLVNFEVPKDAVIGTPDLEVEAKVLIPYITKYGTPLK